jgi:uncharacterized membrane protein YfcA
VIHRPKVNFIKVLIMLAANIIGDVGGIYILGNIYGVAITTVFPTLIGVIIGYYALRKYQHFSLWEMYTCGYSELKILGRNIFGKNK